MPVTIAYILGAVCGLAAAVVAFIMIVPDQKREKLNPFFRYIHDLFNFKSLWIEKIMKFLYIFETLACIGIGFFMLFSVAPFTRSYMGLYGILLILLGPVVVRILYEFIMLAILAVKNLIELNNKTLPQEGSVADKKAKEEARLAAERAEYQKRQQELRAQFDLQRVQYTAPTQPQFTQQPQQYTSPVQYNQQPQQYNPPQAQDQFPPYGQSVQPDQSPQEKLQ